MTNNRTEFRESLKENLLLIEKANEIYGKYIRKFGHEWDEADTQKAQETVGILHLFNAELIQFMKNSEEDSPLLPEDFEGASHYLKVVEQFAQKLIEELEEFV